MSSKFTPVASLSALLLLFSAANTVIAGPILVFDPAFGSSNSPATGATAEVDFEFTAVNPPPGLFDLELTISNTTGSGSFIDPTIPTSGATESTLMGFGFDLPDGMSIVSGSYQDVNGFFPYLVFDVTLNPLGTVDVAIQKNSSLTGGNPNGGLTEGLTATVNFDLLTDPILNTAEIEDSFTKGFSNHTLDSFARFQAVTGGLSDKLGGGLTPPPGGTFPPVVFPPSDVPTPSTVTLLALAAVALGVMRRRRKPLLRAAS